MIVLDLSILNQKGTPMFNSDTLANRPAAGIVGRIFIAIDSPFGIYRDTGSAWDQISGASTFSGSLATGQVTFGSATNTISGTNNFFWDNTNRILGIGSNTPVTSTGGAAGLVINSGANADCQIRVQSNATGSTNLDGFIFSINSALNAFLWNYESAALIFGTNNTERFRVSSSGNVLIGSSVDAGQLLQVYGNLLISNSAASGTFFEVKRTGTTDRYFRVLSTGNIEASSISIGDPNFQFLTGVNNTSTTGDRRFFWLQNNFSPTSGIATYRSLEITTTINQTGGANGISRGLYINPTLTAAADWRSIEWSNNTGWGIYGAGTALSYFGGSVGIKTTSPYSPSTFSLDVNGGLLVKNTAGTTAQITLINADPSIGGNEGFLVTSVGGTSGSSYAELQGYYGLSVTGSTALRLNPAGGSVIINSTTNSGEQFQLTGTLRINGQQSATSGGNSGQHLIINLDGTTYKIKLELP